MRFCPYCGMKLSERSKFCSQCGKASSPRQRSSAVAVEDPSAETDAHESRASESHAVDKPRSKATARMAEPGPRVEQAGELASVERGRVKTSDSSGVKRSTNGSSATRSVIRDRRFAPSTHSLVGALEQAGFGLRYGAWMFDFLITLIAIMTFTFVVTAVSRRSVVGSNRDLVLVMALTVLLFVLNFVVLAGREGQSAGMRILGIRIARVDGRPFTTKDAAVRHLVGYPLSVAAFFLGFLWMLWDPRQQGWHDKLARTIVVMSR
jgi:uncharacterized RDD family membrane protein YckC